MPLRLLVHSALLDALLSFFHHGGGFSPGLGARLPQIKVDFCLCDAMFLLLKLLLAVSIFNLDIDLSIGS